jgi:hypothetical protein
MVSYCYAQNSSVLLFSKKGSKSLKALKPDTTLNASDIQTLSFVLNYNADQLPKFDVMEIIIQRPEVDQVKISKEPAYFKMNAKASTKMKGYSLFEAKMLDFIINPQSGEGAFDYDTYRAKAGHDFFLASRATEYSNCPTQSEYELTVSVVGLTIARMETTFNKATKEYISYPIYNDPIQIVEPIKLSIITNPNIKPRPKSDFVGDPEDLKSLLMGDSEAKSELGDKICDCLKKAKEANNEKEMKKCTKLHEKTFLNIDFTSDDRQPYINRVKACEKELAPGTLNWYGN